MFFPSYINIAVVIHLFSCNLIKAYQFLPSIIIQPPGMNSLVQDTAIAVTALKEATGSGDIETLAATLLGETVSG